MNKTEKENLKLQIENKNLRDQIEKIMVINRKNIYEIVELRMKIELIEYALQGNNIP